MTGNLTFVHNTIDTYRDTFLFCLWRIGLGHFSEKYRLMNMINLKSRQACTPLAGSLDTFINVIQLTIFQNWRLQASHHTKLERSICLFILPHPLARTTGR